MNEEREKFLESLKPPTEEEVGGEVDYSNVIINAQLQEEMYWRKNKDKKDNPIEKQNKKPKVEKLLLVFLL